MKRYKIISLCLAVATVLCICSGCSAENDIITDDYNDALSPDENSGSSNLFPSTSDKGGDSDSEDGGYTEDSSSHLALNENPFISTIDEPLSTFSADVDTASYAYFRKLCQKYTQKQLTEQIKLSPLRTEEMVNYFDYSYTPPKRGEIFGATATISKAPWSKDSHLLVLGLSSAEIEQRSANNLVFLIDVSGSMDSSDKLPLIKKAFSALVSKLDENDVVSIVTYSGKEEVILSGCRGNRSDEILAAVNSLVASGNTNGEAGLTKAYSIAKEHFTVGGNNRIIMASDGDLNVGISSPDALKEFISAKRDEGIFLSVLGFGTGNYKDSTMSALAQNGNGVYYYIDCENEAKKVFENDIISTLYTIAKDVKFQLGFNSELVSKYRLVGYENRLLNKEDFEDNTRDAGDVGAGHAVTVCYELILTENALSVADPDSEIASLAIRYKAPDSDKSEEQKFSVSRSKYTDAPSDDFKFICAVIETAMIFNNSRYNKNQVTLNEVYALLSTVDLSDDPYKLEFRDIISGLL